MARELLPPLDRVGDEHLPFRPKLDVSGEILVPPDDRAGVLLGIGPNHRITCRREPGNKVAGRLRAADQLGLLAVGQSEVPLELFVRLAPEPNRLEVAIEFAELFGRHLADVAGDLVEAQLTQLEEVGAEESDRIVVGLVVLTHPFDEIEDLLGRPERRRQL